MSRDPVPAPRRGRLPVLLGLDAGQTVCKAALFDLDGRELFVAGEANEVSSPMPRWQERDPEEVWRQACRAVNAVLGRATSDFGAIQVLGVGICGHGDGVYLVDQDGEPVRPAILATDSRAFLEAARFARGAVGHRVLALTGQVPFAASPAAVLSWLQKHEPGTLHRAEWILSCKDYLRLRLTGAAATDPTDASASFVAVHQPGWSDQALKLFGLDELARLLPPIRASDEIAGTVSSTAAQQTGLAPGTPVVAGAHDVDAAALGIGAVQPGAASAVLGTWSINQVLAPAPTLDPRWQARVFAQPGAWLHMSTSPAGAGNLDWAVQRLGPFTPDGRPDLDAAVHEAATSTGATATKDALGYPLFLPFLYGAPNGKEVAAAWAQIRGWHRRADLLYAVLEGVAFNHRTHLDQLRERFAMPQPLRVCGGGARSDFWTQILADVLHTPIEVTDAQEAGARGASLLAGMGIGVYKDLGDAVDRAVHVVREQSPRAERTELVDQRYRRYQLCVRALTDGPELDDQVGPATEPEE